MRVVIADDVLLIRSGLSTLLGGAGVDVVGAVGNAEDLLQVVALEHPDAAVVDVRMPPTQTDEGIAAAHAIRHQHPGTSVILLSQYLVPRYAQRLLADRPAGLGYLLKQRVTDADILVDALHRVTAGESVIDQEIVTKLMRQQRSDSPVHQLSQRERQILSLMAEGRSNAGIAQRLVISERTVESTCAQVFRKLDLARDPADNRRVLAVLAVLRQPRTGQNRG